MSNLIEEILDWGIHLHEYHITIGDVLVIITIFAVIHFIILGVKQIITRSSRKVAMDVGKQFTILKLLKYLLYVIGAVISLETVGIDVTILIAGSAALLVGVGLGLQNIFNDIVSGFVILFEGAVRVGDIIDLDGYKVTVQKVDFRTTKVKTLDGNFLIVPNSKMTNDTLLNWKHQTPDSRINIKVGVAYSSDVQLVSRLLKEAANQHKLVLKSRPADVIFEDFGDSSLNFILRFYINKPWEAKDIQSEIRFEIHRLFDENNVSIPFPQRDVHHYNADIPMAD